MILAHSVRAAAADPDKRIDWLELGKFFGEEAGGPLSPAQAEQVSPVAAAHRLLTNQFGLIPYGLYERKEGARVPVEDAALTAMLKGRPNPNHSMFALRKTVMSNAFWYGWGAVWNRRDHNGTLVERIPLPTDCGTIRRDNSTGMIWYDFTVDGVQRTFSSYDLSILRFESHDGIQGRGLLTMAKSSIRTDAKAQEYQRKFYENGARISAIVEVDSDADSETRDAIRREFNRFSREDAFKMAVLDHGMKVTPLGISQTDAQYLESRGFTVEEISRFTGVPKYMLQSGKESYDSNRQQRVDYVTDVLVPYVVQWEQEDTYKLLVERQREKGWYVHGNPSVLLRGDDESRFKVYQAAIYDGVLNPDECRELEERAPIPGGLGKTHFITKNLASLEAVAKGAT